MQQQDPRTVATDIPDLLNPDQVCQILGVPLNTLYRWHSASTLEHPVGPKALRVGRHLRYSTEDLTAYIDHLRTNAS